MANVADEGSIGYISRRSPPRRREPPMLGLSRYRSTPASSKASLNARNLQREKLPEKGARPKRALPLLCACGEAGDPGGYSACQGIPELSNHRHDMTVRTAGNQRRNLHLLVRFLLGDRGGAQHGLLIALVRLRLRRHTPRVHPVDPVSRPARDIYTPLRIRGTPYVPAALQTPVRDVQMRRADAIWESSRKRSMRRG